MRQSGMGSPVTLVAASGSAGSPVFELEVLGRRVCVGVFWEVDALDAADPFRRAWSAFGGSLTDEEVRAVDAWFHRSGLSLGPVPAPWTWLSPWNRHALPRSLD